MPSTPAGASWFIGGAMRLYSFFRYSAAFRVRIALNLKKIAYETVAIHLRRNDQSKPDYRAVNPQGLVPTLEYGGLKLIQSLAIIEYLDEILPDPPLLPKDPADRARVRALAEIVACDIHPINNLRVLRYLTQELSHDEAAIAEWYNHWIAQGFEALEPLLASDARTGAFCHWRFAGLCRHRSRPSGRQCRALPAQFGAVLDPRADFRELHAARPVH